MPARNMTNQDAAEVSLPTWQRMSIKNVQPAGDEPRALADCFPDGGFYHRFTLFPFPAHPPFTLRVFISTH
jgi:hypothetical protein